MATNGSFTTTPRYASDSTNKKWYIFSWSLISQSVANNTSTISYSVTGGGSKSSGYVMSYDRSVTIQGTQVYTSSADIQLRTGTEITSGTQVIQHDNNGNATLSASISSHIASTGSGGVSNGSSSWALPQIPRYSTITTNTNVVMGSTQEVTIEQKNIDFSSIVYYKTSLGEEIELGRFADSISSTFVWQVPDISSEWLEAQTDTYRIICKTYTNNDYTGTLLQSTLDVIANVPSDVVPLGSMTITDQETMPSGWGFVIGYSKPRATLTFDNSQDRNGYLKSAICRFGSVETQTFDATGTTTTQAVFDCTKTIVSQQPVISASIYDSRGRTVDFTQTLNAMVYNKPQVYVELTRCDASGNPSIVDTYAKVRARWVVQSVEVGGSESNSATIEVKNGSTTLLTYTVPNLTQNTLVDIGVVSNIPVEQDTTLTITIADALASTTITNRVPKSNMPFSAWSDGNDNGIAFGKPALSKDFYNYMNTYLVSGNSYNLLDNAGNVIDTITTDDLFETPIATTTEVGGVLSGGDITVDATGKMTISKEYVKIASPELVCTSSTVYNIPNFDNYKEFMFRFLFTNTSWIDVCLVKTVGTQSNGLALSYTTAHRGYFQMINNGTGKGQIQFKNVTSSVTLTLKEVWAR